MIDVEYLDKLAANKIAAGLDATGEYIKSAALEIRRLRLALANLENAATLPLVDDALSAKIRSTFAEMNANGEIEIAYKIDSFQIEDTVRDMIRNGRITVSSDIKLEVEEWN